MKNKEKPSPALKLCYGIGAFGKDAVYALVGTYLMMYLTDYRSVDPAFVGILFMIARIWDAFNDPFMGMIVDNTRTRFGKFRPWILAGTVLNAAVLVLLFSGNEIGGTSYLVRCSVLYILWGMTYTVMDIPYWSMVPALTDDENERNQISAIPRIFASLAWLIINSAGLYLVTVLGRGNDLRGFSRLAIITAAVFIVSSAVTCAFCRERIFSVKKEKTGFRSIGTVLFKNDQVKMILGIALFFNIAYQLSNGFALYYFKYIAERTYAAEGNGLLYPVYAGVAGFAQMGAMAAFPITAKKLGRKFTVTLASFLPVFGFALLWLFGHIAPTSVYAVGIASAVINCGVGLMLVLITVILSDTVDYGEYRLGTRNESVIFSMQTFVVKFAGAFSGFVSGIGLSLIGFVPNVRQSAATETGMRIIMFLIPAVLSALCFVIYKKANTLTPQFMDEIHRTIRIKKEG